MARKRALGKGLEALLPERNFSSETETVTLEVEALIPNPQQPRKDMNPDRLQELAESIRRYGVIQPIAVRRCSEEPHEIIAGERRWRAAQLAGLERIPVYFLEDPQEMGLLGLIENLQREDLSPLEVASGIAALQREKDLTQEQIAEALGWSRSGVTNKLRLLQLPLPLQEMISQGILHEGHGRALLGLTEEEMLGLAEKIVDRDLSVRQTETLVQQIKNSREEPEEKSEASGVSEKEQVLAENLRKRFGVTIQLGQRGKKCSIKLMSLESEKRDLFLEHLLEVCEKIFPGK